MEDQVDPSQDVDTFQVIVAETAIGDAAQNGGEHLHAVVADDLSSLTDLDPPPPFPYLFNESRPLSP